MPTENALIARRFEDLADLLEVAGENPFRVRAYREAAGVLRGHPEPLRDAVEQGDDLSELSGIGAATARKVAEIVELGRLPALERAIEATGEGIARLLRVPGLGPKRLRKLREELGTGEARAIAEAARAGRVREIAGFGAGLERKVLETLGDAASEDPAGDRTAPPEGA